MCAYRFPSSFVPSSLFILHSFLLSTSMPLHMRVPLFHALWFPPAGRLAGREWCKLTFVLSQPLYLNEMKGSRHRIISWTDFLEVVGRSIEYKSLPPLYVEPHLDKRANTTRLAMALDLLVCSLKPTYPKRNTNINDLDPNKPTSASKSPRQCKGDPRLHKLRCDGLGKLKLNWLGLDKDGNKETREKK